MSEERTETGQFDSSEPLTGRAAIEHDAGYVPMPEEESEPQKELTAREAAAKVAERRTDESKIVTHVAGFKMPANMTMTIDQAAKVVKDGRDADNAQAELEEADRVRAEVDNLRGEGAEGVEKPAAKAETLTNSDGEPDIEKVLSHPRVSAAISERVAEAETQRQHFETAIQEVGKIRIAALAGDFPELANLPIPQWRGALEAMAQREPARYQQAISRIQAVAQVEAVSQQLKAQKAELQQAEFKTYAAKENTRFAELTKAIPAKEMAAIEAHVPKMLAEHGADVRQFLEAVSNQSTFPRATAEALLVKAARYDLLMAAPKALASHPVPHVQRPGTQQIQPRVSPATSKIDALKRAFDAKPSAKTAAALTAARRAARS